ncbi:MAG: oxidoreductase, partial [Actinomycetota bacterium]|nr:oxidoreductase [Actinomycetota bacterium]
MTATPRERPARLQVGVVGCGRVGSVLGAALARAGHRVVAVSGVSPPTLRRAGQM